MAGTELYTVIFSFFITLQISLISLESSTWTSEAPAICVPNKSYIDKSKQSDETPRILSSSDILNLLLISKMVL